MTDLFPIKLNSGATGAVALLFVSIVALILNAALWFAVAFIAAYGAAKGWTAA